MPEFGEVLVFVVGRQESQLEGGRLPLEQPLLLEGPVLLAPLLLLEFAHERLFSQLELLQRVLQALCDPLYVACPEHLASQEQIGGDEVGEGARRRSVADTQGDGVAAEEHLDEEGEGARPLERDAAADLALHEGEPTKEKSWGWSRRRLAKSLRLVRRKGRS